MLKDAARVLFVPFAEKANSDYLKKVQTILKDKGYDPGPIDGKWGKKTELALRKYQMDIGLKVTGKLGQETQKSLGLK
ncbi:MAG: peptidoglycan-binding protein [Candidatus Heimdallarchaeota archaeon]|nr:peptidoglycan-binding protein [Candidatus Heimdallarchaeota archaeon]